MPEYLSPGVFIEETSFRGKPIEGVSTSTAGFVGRARKGPEGRPVFVDSLARFREVFGEAYSAPATLGEYLGHAVRGFFENGGLRAYVVRVLGDGAVAAEIDLHHGTVLRLPPSTTILSGTRIRLNSLRNLGVGTTLHFFVRSSATDPFVQRHAANVTAYDSLRGTVDIDAPLPAGVVLSRDNCYIRRAAGAPLVLDAARRPSFVARSRGESGEDLSVLVTPVDRPPVRLAAREFERVRPLLETYAGTGPNGVAVVPVSATSARMLRASDGLQLNDGSGTTEDHVVQSIDTATVTVTTGAGTSQIYAAGATLSLVQRAGGPALATPAVVFETTAAVDLSADGDVTFEHAAAAFFEPGDTFRIDDGTNHLDFTTDVIALAGSITLTAAVTADFSSGTLRLMNTPGRLLVGDVTGLSAPNRDDGAEPIAVYMGSDVTDSTIRLAETQTGAVWFDPADQLEINNTSWDRLESLQVATGGDTTLRVASAAGFYAGAIVEVDTGTTKTYGVVDTSDAAARTVTLVAALPGALGFVDVPAEAGQRAAFVRVLEIDVDVLENGVVLESFPGLTWNANPASASFSRYYVERINDEANGSRLVEVTAPTTTGSTPDDQPSSANGFPQALENGDDGAAPEARHFIGRDDGPGTRTGIEALKDVDNISIVAAPGITEEAVQAALITHCELMKYRIAVLDGPRGVSDVNELLAHRNNYDSKYAAYYANWLEVLNLSNGRTLTVPPSGHVIGIYARSDNERGVHKAPANEVVRGITGLEFIFTTGEQDILNPNGVNLIREFFGRGIRVWGARTISSDAEWKYVNVRRLFIFLEASIDRGTQWVVFEPNNPSLWDRVRETIESFLFGVWTTGAFEGGTPDKSYFVRIDRTTMTQDDLDNGRLVALIGIAPTRPAEFVIFRIGQFTASTN